MQILYDYIKNYGKFIRIWLGNQLVIIMIDPVDVDVNISTIETSLTTLMIALIKHQFAFQAVLTNMKLITKSNEYNFMTPWLGTGLLTSTGWKWLSRRKVLTPAFHFKILEDFVEIFDAQSSILVKKLKKFEGRGEFDIFPLTALCALDVICGKFSSF